MSFIDRIKGLRGWGAELARQTIEPTFYNAGIQTYALGVRCVATRNPKAQLLARGQRDVWQKLASSIDHSRRYVWVHAASLGEFEQGRPLIEKIRREKPEYHILLTFFSPSGFTVRKDYPGADCVCYLPFDTPGKVNRFLDLVRPEIAIFVKYEIWRNYLRGLYKRQIPTFLISAAFRPEQAFFHKRGAWYRYWLHWYTTIFVQDERSHALLETAGIRGSIVAGDTRFDRVTDIRLAAKEIPELERFRNADSRPIIIAGSSWEPDEEIYLSWLRKHRSNAKLVIAPHEFDKRRIQHLCNDPELSTVSFSKLKENPTLADTADCIVMDCFGLLSSAYRYGDLAYIGGGFGAGIHNINEAAVYDIPVVFGPRFEKFIEAKEIIQAGGGFTVDSIEAFSKLMDNTLIDSKIRSDAGKKAGNYIRSKLGATNRIFAHIFK